MEVAIWMALFIILWVAYEDIYSNTWVGHHFCADSMKGGTVLVKKAKLCMDIHSFIFFKKKKEWKDPPPPSNSECMDTKCLSPLTFSTQRLAISTFNALLSNEIHFSCWQLTRWIKSLYKINNFAQVRPKLIYFTLCLWSQTLLALSGGFV